MIRRNECSTMFSTRPMMLGLIGGGDGLKVFSSFSTMASIGRLIAVVFCLTSVAGMSFEMRRLSSATNQFGFDLLRALHHRNSSFVICPFCLSSQLAMIGTGLDPTDRFYSSL